MSHKDKTTIVTGASSGIGAETARALGRHGAQVILLARNPDRLAQVAADIEASGGKATVMRADITDAAQVAQAADDISRAFARIDYLVNCAGVFLPTPVGGTDTAAMDAMINTNLRGTMLTCNAIAPLMMKQGAGAIVNIASVAGIVSVSGFNVYCATKAGVIMYSRSLARELAPHGVRVNILAPGNTATPMNEGARADSGVMDAFAAITPSKRTFSPPEEMAGTILYLLSDQAKAMYGAVLVADEGLSLGF